MPTVDRPFPLSASSVQPSMRKPGRLSQIFDQCPTISPFPSAKQEFLHLPCLQAFLDPMEFDNWNMFSREPALDRRRPAIQYSYLSTEQSYWPLLSDHAPRAQHTPFMNRKSLARATHTTAAHSHHRQSVSPPSASPQSVRRSKRLAGQDPSPEADTLGEASSKRRQLASVRSEDSVIRRSAVGTAVEKSPPSELWGMITVAFSSQPPIQVRTGRIMPPLGVRVTIKGTTSSAQLGSSMGLGTLHAVVSLWSADGQVASPHTVPPPLTGHRDATLINMPPDNGTSRQAEAVFRGLVISHSGCYRLRVSIMETPLPEEDGNGELHSPRPLLSVESRPIRAHGFVDVK